MMFINLFFKSKRFSYYDVTMKFSGGVEGIVNRRRTKHCLRTSNEKHREAGV